jgi:hypothetical protein
MDDDLVDRLNERAKVANDRDAVLMHEAAQEIEHMRFEYLRALSVASLASAYSGDR